MLQRELNKQVVYVSEDEARLADDAAGKESLQSKGGTKPVVRITHDPKEEYPGQKRMEIWLYRATKNNFVGCMRLLIQHNAPILPTLGGPRHTQSLLSMAVRNKCVDAVNLLLAQGPHKMPRGYADLALAIAYEVRHVPSIAALFKYGASVRTMVSAMPLDHVEEMQIPPLSYAVEANDYKMVTLLAKHLNTDEEDFDEFPSPLVRAVRRHNMPMIFHLVAIGVNVNPKVKKQPLPLGEAASLGFPNVIDLLIDWGAEINSCDQEGLSALDHALSNADDDIVDKLLEFNPIISELTFRAVAERGSVEGLQRLLDRRQFIHPELLAYGLCEAVAEGEEELVKMFLECGTDMWHYGSSRHALYIAVGQDFANIVKMLLDYGQATQRFEPQHGATALCRAVNTQNVPIAETLLSRGANPNIATQEAASALHAAIPTGNTTLIQLLLIGDASVHTRTDSGVTIMDAAVSTGSNEIVKLILAYGGDSADVTPNMVELAGASGGEPGGLLDKWPTG